MSDSDRFINASLLSIQFMNARKSQKLSQDELSKQSGVSKSTISDLENLGKEKNPTLNSFLACLDSMGYDLSIKRRDYKDDDTV